MTEDKSPDRPPVDIGQLWRRKNGVVYVTAEKRVEDLLDYYLLVPVVTPSGVKARRTWKYGAHIEFDLTFDGNAPDALAQGNEQMAVHDRTRQEHLDWCKQRAIALIDAGDISGALPSFLSDVGQHPLTEGVAQTIGTLGVTMLLAGHLSTAQQMRDHINGYN
jgi:hypothetical protein